jgi:hypothetical protein
MGFELKQDFKGGGAHVKDLALFHAFEGFLKLLRYVNTHAIICPDRVAKAKDRGAYG